MILPKSITKTFNFVLFLYLVANLLLLVLVEPDAGKDILWDKFFGSLSPFLSAFILLAISIFLIVWGAFIGKFLWNRFIVDVFGIREINFDEALALALILEVLTI